MSEVQLVEGSVDFEEAIGVIRHAARIGSQKLLNRLEKFHGKFADNPEVVLTKQDDFKTPFDRRAYRRQYYLDHKERLKQYDRNRRQREKERRASA